MQGLSEDCINELNHKRTRGESGSSTETTESFIISDDGNDSSSEECLQPKCKDTYHLDINDNELHTNKYKEFQRLSISENLTHNDNEFKRKDCEEQRYRHAYTHNRTKKNWKLLSFILSILVILMVFAFFWEFNEIRDIKSQLMLTDIKRPISQKSIRLPPIEFTAISLRGNGQLERGKKGIPILNWNLHIKHGNIAFLEGKKIHIKKTGLYNLYAQMFFYQNAVFSKRNFSENPVMDFGVREARTNERIIAAAVSLNSCKYACTRHISSIVRLNEGQILTVDTATPGVYFKMIKEKALFGTYLISDVDDATETGHVT